MSKSSPTPATRKTLAPIRRAAKVSTPPAPVVAIIELDPVDPVIISPLEVEGLAMELAAFTAQMQEQGHDLLGLLRKAAKDSYGIDLPARPIEVVEDAGKPGEYTAEERGLASKAN